MSNQFQLNEKTILVTGASSGIGRQICISSSKMGATIIATGRNVQRLHATMDDLTGDGHIMMPADLLNNKDIVELINQLPAINGVVHSAGIVNYIPMKMINENALEKIQKINYYAPLLFTKDLIKNKKLIPKSSIVFIASISYHIAIAGNGLYAGSKAGLIATARVLALELAKQKIRVNCLAPGMIRTPMFKEAEQVVSAEQLIEHEKLYPFGYGEPDDIANATIFLLSDASKWITGTTLIIDGGYTIK
jgi:NAD(P)-dependent dehydrogenase (short-subunit alcohol dehydrogenase family)